MRGPKGGAHGAAVHGRGGGADAGGERHDHRLLAAGARPDAAGGERAGGGAQARRHIRRQCMSVYHEHLTTSDDVMGTADFRAVSELVPFLDEDEDSKEEGSGDDQREPRWDAPPRPRSRAGACRARAPYGDCFEGISGTSSTVSTGAPPGRGRLRGDASTESRRRRVGVGFWVQRRRRRVGAPDGVTLSRHRRRARTPTQSPPGPCPSAVR